MDLRLTRTGVALTQEDVTTRFDVVGTASYTLVPLAGGPPAASGVVRSITGYSAPESPGASAFAAQAALEDAEHRLAVDAGRRHRAAAGAVGRGLDVKLAGREAARFLARPDPAAAGVLLFGADAMRVALKRAALVEALIGPEGAAEMRLTRIAAGELRRDPAALLDAVKAVGLLSPGRGWCWSRTRPMPRARSSSAR